jgi:heat shock protein HslJ
MVPGADITFEVEGSTVGGRSACNQYFGEFVLENGVVRLGGLGGTEMGCDEPTMASELAYMGALAQITAARMEGDELVLLGDGVELRFERLEPPPTAELIGTTWLLDGLVSGDAVASTIGEPATLELDADGTFIATTGCRTLTGRYTTTQAVIEITEMRAEGECAGGPADQDTHVMDVLEGGFRAEVSGQSLTLTGDGNRGLIYLGPNPP